MNKFKYILFYGGLLLLMMFITTSCVTEKKRAEICATCPMIIKDSIITQTTKFDTTLFIDRFGQDISLRYNGAYTDYINELNELFKKYNDTIQTYKNGIRTKIIRTPSKIIFTCKADSLKYLLQLERQKKSIIKTITVQKPWPKCALKHRSGFDMFLRWLFWIILGFIAIRNLPAFLKSLIHNIKNFR